MPVAIALAAFSLNPFAGVEASAAPQELQQGNLITGTVVDEDGIASISAGTPVRVKVYSLNGILLGSFECTRSEVKARMQQEHLGRGTFVVRMQSADRSETVKIIL